MLILKINEEIEKKQKVRGVFRKRIIGEPQQALKRYSITVNNKQVLVLELTEKELESDDTIKLLKIYKGNVLVSEGDKNIGFLQSFLFDPKEYYQRAVLSSLKNQIKTVNKDWKNICVKIDNFIPLKELFEIVKISKNVTLITSKNQITEKFLNDCYYEFGAIVSVKGECPWESDVYVDLDRIESNGKLMINAKGKTFLLYPDATYFVGNTEYHKLMPFNIEHNIICAAFPDK